MAFNDPIAELLTKIRNAQLHQHVYMNKHNENKYHLTTKGKRLCF